MKLFKRGKKVDNKGFSLVEVLCAITIMGLATTAIGSAMIVSTQNYQRGNAEVEVQKEAQTTTNLIGNLLVDSLEADWTVVGSEKKLTIMGEGVTYELLYNTSGDEIKYTEKIGASTTSGILAENVSDFNVDLTNFATDKNAMVEVAIEKNGKNYEATYNTTSRNGSANSIGAEEVAQIMVVDDVILEPGQSYDIPISVIGMSAAEAGIKWSNPEPSALAGSVVGTSQIKNKSEGGATIYVGPEAKGAFVFTVSTDKKDASGLPLDTQTVTVYVRRVNDIGFNCTLTSGNAFKKDAKYHITATAVGDKMENSGREYDDPTVKPENAYKNPKYLDLKVSMAGYSVSEYVKVVDFKEDVDAPYIDIQLLQDMPAGSTITITATSKHAEGSFTNEDETATIIYNKTGTDYGPVTKDYPIEQVSTAHITFPNGVKRGQDFMFEVDSDWYSKVNSEFASMGTPHYFMRFRVEGGEWTQYYHTLQGSASNKKINADETMLWDADKDVEFEMILVYLSEDETKLMWPNDVSLLEPDMNYGFEEYGITQGWTAENLVGKTMATSNFADYGVRYTLGAAQPAFTKSSNSETVDIGVNSDEFVSHVGTLNSPILLPHVNSSKIRIGYDILNMEKGQYKYFCYVEYYDTVNSKWIDVTDKTTGTYFNIQGNGDKGDNGDIFLSDIKDVAPDGTYRIGVMLKEQKYREIIAGESTLMNLKWTDMKYDKNFKLYNDKSGTEGYNLDGYVYFKLYK